MPVTRTPWAPGEPEPAALQNLKPEGSLRSRSSEATGNPNMIKNAPRPNLNNAAAKYSLIYYDSKFFVRQAQVHLSFLLCTLLVVVA